MFSFSSNRALCVLTVLSEMFNRAAMSVTVFPETSKRNIWYSRSAEELLPLVYDELRKLAAERMVQEKPGQTLQATALVHEAYLRLVDVEKAQHWHSRGHFFAAAAEAMRRILVESARRKGRLKHGREHQRVDLDSGCLVSAAPSLDLLALDEALSRLAETEPLVQQPLPFLHGASRRGINSRPLRVRIWGSTLVAWGGT